MWTVPADDPRYAGDQHPAGPVERAIDKAVETVTGRCRWVCGDVECPERCRNLTGRRNTTTTTTTTTTSSSGATMTSADTYSGLRARIMGVASRAPERQGPLQQALQGAEEDIAELNSISEDSSQPGIQEALGSLMRAKESIEEANWMVGAAQASTEGAAAALQ